MITFREALERLRKDEQDPAKLEAILLLEKLVESYREAFIKAGR